MSMNPTAPQPWMKFYVQDWLCSEKLRLISFAAKGILIDALCAMHRSMRPGYLVQETIEGFRPLTLPLTCRVMGWPLEEAKPLWDELLKSGVLKQDHEGYFYSKRMADLYNKALICKEFGKKGGNPTLTHRVNPTLNPDPYPASDSDSDSNKKEEECEKKPKLDDANLNKKIINLTEATTALEYLNKICGTRFQLVNTNLEHLRARFAEGVTLDQVKKVIDFQFNEWSGEEKSRKWLRPKTLFTPTNFHNYLGQAEATPISQKKIPLIRDHYELQAQEEALRKKLEENKGDKL